MKTAIGRAGAGAPLLADGAIGTELRRSANPRAEPPGPGALELGNLSDPERVRAVHAAYARAGARCLTTNTFGALDALRALGDRAVDALAAGVRLARAVADEAGGERFVLGSIGPGALRLRAGEIDAAALRERVARAARALLAEGVDGLVLETSIESCAVAESVAELAPLAGDVALVVSAAVDRDGRLPDGTAAAELARALPPGVDLFALNCTNDLADAALAAVRAATDRPLGWWPNAGVPVRGPRGWSWPVEPAPFATAVAAAARRHGLALVGGCCGTGPAHVEALARALAGPVDC